MPGWARRRPARQAEGKPSAAGMGRAGEFCRRGPLSPQKTKGPGFPDPSSGSALRLPLRTRLATRPRRNFLAVLPSDDQSSPVPWAGQGSGCLPFRSLREPDAPRFPPQRPPAKVPHESPANRHFLRPEGDLGFFTWQDCLPSSSTELSMVSISRSMPSLWANTAWSCPTENTRSRSQVAQRPPGNAPPTRSLTLTPPPASAVPWSVPENPRRTLSRERKRPPRCVRSGLDRIKNRRRPTLPGSCPPSTIGAERLNGSVRNGKRCFPLAISPPEVFKRLLDEP